jgi:hypothetical protein
LLLLLPLLCCCCCWVGVFGSAAGDFDPEYFFMGPGEREDVLFVEAVLVLFGGSSSSSSLLLPWSPSSSLFSFLGLLAADGEDTGDAFEASTAATTASSSESSSSEIFVDSRLFFVLSSVAVDFSRFKRRRSSFGLLLVLLVLLLESPFAVASGGAIVMVLSLLSIAAIPLLSLLSMSEGE